MTNLAVSTSHSISGHALEWLALALTPGIGPTRARRMTDFFGGIEALFHASLTELEATGIQAAAAQSLGRVIRSSLHTQR